MLRQKCKKLLKNNFREDYNDVLKGWDRRPYRNAADTFCLQDFVIAVSLYFVPQRTAKVIQILHKVSQNIP